MVPSGGSGGGPISLPFLAPGGCLHSLAHNSFLQSLQCLASVITSPTSSFDFLGSLIQEPLGLHLRPIQIMRNNLYLHLEILNPITSASSFCHTRQYSQVPGIRVWMSVEGHYPASPYMSSQSLISLLWELTLHSWLGWKHYSQVLYLLASWVFSFVWGWLFNACANSTSCPPLICKHWKDGR